ncbi:hypothetical protein [Candidatus Uabimicrobium amorphum]|uniref:Alginate export domain-containing protein n=1 Tax=Uabimicrobium amorphum TaxID=2596890 RepID=A0A5S9ILJ6_UABAM|nr:hypothetical protein [Candidatus Uabimicrobium amorphum]BBM82795.1 hypothetical protein UABAM_01138 [Candidatus Uabimicrobium amorphum]
MRIFLLTFVLVITCTLFAQEDDFFPPEEDEIRSEQEGDFFPPEEEETRSEDEDDFFPDEEKEIRSEDEDNFFPDEEEEIRSEENNDDFFPDEENEKQNENEEQSNNKEQSDNGEQNDNEKQSNNESENTDTNEGYDPQETYYQEEDDYGGGAVIINEDRDVRNIMISGTLGFNYVFREDLFADAVLADQTTNLDGDFFDPRLTLRLDIMFNQNIQAVLELHNEVRVATQLNTGLLANRSGNLFITNRAEENNFIFEIERAYLNISDFLFSNTMLQIGIIPKRYALRANGDAFFLDLGESESPFNDGDPNVDEDGEDINARGFVYRWQMSDAFQLSQVFQADLEAFYFNTQENGFLRQDQSIAGINLDLDFSKTVVNEDESEALLVRFFNVIVAAIFGDNNQPIWSVGFGFDYFMSNQPDVYLIEFYGETLFQFGILDRKNLAPAFANKNQAHLAFGGYLGTRFSYEKSDWKPFVDISMWYISGDDDDPNRDKNSDLVTFEDIDSTIIVEENDYGLDVDSNYWAVKFQSGISLKPLTSEEMRLEILYAHFEAIDTTNTSRHIGEEIDVRVVWEYSSDLTFVLAAGVLFNSTFFKDVFDELGADGDQSVFMLRFETLLRF